jgi:hypothetical protein
VEPTPELETRQHLSATVPAVRDRVHRLQLDYEAVVTDYLCELDAGVPRVDAMMISGAIFGAFVTIPDILAARLESGPPTNYSLARATSSSTGSASGPRPSA